MSNDKQELEALRKWKADHQAKQNTVKQAVQTQPKPKAKVVLDVKQDKRRANKSLQFDYSSTYFTKALQQASQPV
ncbi:TPA: hypothetical protein JLG68_001372 [Escherichia coli]|nr:hypothetical protein [Escherichia coli]